MLKTDETRNISPSVIKILSAADLIYVCSKSRLSFIQKDKKSMKIYLKILGDNGYFLGRTISVKGREQFLFNEDIPFKETKINILIIEIYNTNNILIATADISFSSLTPNVMQTISLLPQGSVNIMLATNYSRSHTLTVSSSLNSSFQGLSRLAQPLRRNAVKRNIHIILSHHFVSTYFPQPTYCSHCTKFMWGVFNRQGYQCKSNIYQYSIIKSVEQ
uniref:Protein kinase C epsilon type (Trinotate prediction) n=1 Tax=Henneguya salminicola TaxID=69463 RepID=A0A6G3MEW6_HENSL